MNRLFSVFAGMLLTVGFVATGCAGAMTPISGLYTAVQGPIHANGDAVSSTKVGKATATSLLGIVATGDCSINAAATAGEVTKISHIDHDTLNILGFYAEFTTVVYGD